MGLEQKTSGITTAQVNWFNRFAEKWHLPKPTTYRSISIEAIGNIYLFIFFFYILCDWLSIEDSSIFHHI